MTNMGDASSAGRGAAISIANNFRRRRPANRCRAQTLRRLDIKDPTMFSTNCKPLNLDCLLHNLHLCFPRPSVDDHGPSVDDPFFFFNPGQTARCGEPRAIRRPPVSIRALSMITNKRDNAPSRATWRTSAVPKLSAEVQVPWTVDLRDLN